MFFDDEDYGGEEERLVQSTRGEYDAEENVLRPKTLEGYVGQSKVKENLTVYMSAAKKRGEALEHVLLYGAPGLGKTTLLRDLIRSVSEGGAALRVSLADERGEVAALYNGLPQLEVGRRTDIVEGCPKAQGLMLLLRAMNPQVLAVDEITAPEDVQALTTAAGCGVTLLATAHGEERADLERRPLDRPLLEEGLFRFLIRIRREGERRIYTVEELR